MRRKGPFNVMLISYKSTCPTCIRRQLPGVKEATPHSPWFGNPPSSLVRAILRLIPSGGYQTDAVPTNLYWNVLVQHGMQLLVQQLLLEKTRHEYLMITLHAFHQQKTFKRFSLIYARYVDRKGRNTATPNPPRIHPSNAKKGTRSRFAVRSLKDGPKSKVGASAPTRNLPNPNSRSLPGGGDCHLVPVGIYCHLYLPRRCTLLTFS